MDLAEVAIKTEEVMPLGSDKMFCERGYSKEIRKDGTEQLNK